MAADELPSCSITRLIVFIYLILFIVSEAGDSNAKTLESTNHSEHRGKIRRESIPEMGGLESEGEPELRHSLDPLDSRATDNKTLIEPEALESVVSSSEATAKNDQEELERLVRSQVDFAASDWATLSPMEHQANLNKHIEQLNLLSNAYNRGAKLLPNENDQRQQVDTSNKQQQEHKQFYPNHNYQYDRESNEPFKYSTGQTDSAGKTQTTTDPMTTSSDRSSRYESHVPQPAYMYRLRGPITASESSKSSSQQDTRRLWYATSSTTLAPKIMLAFQRLDKQRNSSSENELSPSLNFHQNGSWSDGINDHPFRDSVSSSNRVNLISQQLSSIHPQGFMDEPTLQIVSNGQQPPVLPASLDDQAAMGRRDQQQRTQYVRNEPQKTLAASTPPATISMASDMNLAPKQQQQLDKNRSLLEFLSSVHDIRQMQTQTTTPRISPQDLASNLNGNLAARLSANRYKSGHRKFIAKPTTQSSNGDATDRGGGGGTKELQETQNNGNGRAQPLSVSFKGTNYATAITSGPSELMDFAASSSPQTTDPSAGTTTGTSTSTSTAGSKPPWKQTTIPLSSATANPSLFAENSNELAVGNSYSKSLNAAAHHHHLHSHVHSIKPAVISIPIQQQSFATGGSSLGSPKFNPYEGIMAAAAAAAAAATATARARPQQALVARQPAPAYPLAIQHHQQQQVKSSLRPLRKQSSIVSRKFNHNRAPTIPIGGTLASTMQQHHQQQQQQQQQQNQQLYQSSSILGQLLESANRALKHVTRQQQQQQSPKAVPLQTASSNQATPVHSDPNQLRLFSSIINQRANGNAHQLLLNPFLLADSAAAAENFAELTAAAENAPPQSPAIDSVGLFQAPIDATGSPMDTYLASLISPSSFTAWKDEHSDGVYHTLLGSKNNSITSGSSLQEVWDSSNNSSVTSGSSDFPSGDVVFGSLGDDSNLLYPIYSSSSGSLGSGSDQSEAVSLDADGAAGLQLLDDEDIHFGFHPASLAAAAGADSQSDEQMWSIPMEFNQPAPNHLNNSSHAGGRDSERRPGRKVNKNVNNKAKLKKVAVIRRPHNGLSKSPYKKGSAGEMQYALAHYINSDSIEPGSSHFSDLAPGDKTLVAYDLFDDNNNKVAAKFSQPVSSSSSPSQIADAFRPITHPHHYTTYLGDPLGGPSYGGINEAAAAIRGSGRYPRGQSHQSQQQQTRQHLLPDTSNMGNNKGNASSETSTSSISLLNGPGNLFYSPASFLSAAWPHHQMLAAAALQHSSSQHNQHSSQPLLWPASSSHRPHVSAALDLAALNTRALHQLLHGGGGGSGGHHDLATSETARLTSTFGAPAAIGRTAMLVHFWPIALALLPVMIIVAIVAQMVMAAPLVLFAFTTLAVSRLLAPLQSNRRELESPSVADSIKLLQDSTAKLMPNVTATGLLGGFFRGASSTSKLLGSSDRQPKRNTSDIAEGADRKRVKRAAASPMDKYIESLIVKFS